MAIIDDIQNKKGTTVYPRTVTKAIFKAGTNKNMDTVLEDVEASLEDTLIAVDNKVNQVIRIKKNVTIPASGWTEVGQYFENVISDTDITADTIVDVNIHLADLDKADDMKSSNVSSVGKLTLYADKLIEEDILCDMKLIKEVK